MKYLVYPKTTVFYISYSTDHSRAITGLAYKHHRNIIYIVFYVDTRCFSLRARRPAESVHQQVDLEELVGCCLLVLFLCEKMSFCNELSIYTSSEPADFSPRCFCIPDTFLYSPVITFSLREVWNVISQLLAQSLRMFLERRRKSNVGHELTEELVIGGLLWNEAGCQIWSKCGE